MVSTLDDADTVINSPFVVLDKGSASHVESTACIVYVSERVSTTSTIMLGDEDVTAGRGVECSIHIPCSHISRVHAKIVKEDGGWVVYDNQSVNGILVNGVKRDSAVLVFGDRIDLGRGEVLLFRPYDSDYQRVLEAQKIESLGRLASGIAHDFNNVLMAIVGATSCLADDVANGDTSTIEETTADILTASQRGADLARQLLSFARQGHQANDIVATVAVAEEATRLIQRTFEQRIDVQTNFESKSFVVAERGQLVQVLMNLCINARDAMPEGGVLTIAVEDKQPTTGSFTGNFVCLSVQDTGTGMSHEVRQRVFEPFFSTKGEGHGTGLGMATAYGIVKNYGGTIEIDSREGVGTKVSVFLPCQVGLAKGAPSSAGANLITRAIAPRGEGRHILLADDQPLVLRHTSRLLRRLGYEVIEARDGVEAVDLVENATVPICLAMLDLQMPRRSGDEACRMIREIDGELPVVMVSGNIEDPRIEALVDSISVDVLGKPFAPSELALALMQARP